MNTDSVAKAYFDHLLNRGNAGNAWAGKTEDVSTLLSDHQAASNITQQVSVRDLGNLRNKDIRGVFPSELPLQTWTSGAIDGYDQRGNLVKTLLKAILSNVINVSGSNDSRLSRSLLQTVRNVIDTVAIGKGAVGQGVADEVDELYGKIFSLVELENRDDIADLRDNIDTAIRDGSGSSLSHLMKTLKLLSENLFTEFIARDHAASTRVSSLDSRTAFSLTELEAGRATGQFTSFHQLPFTQRLGQSGSQELSSRPVQSGIPSRMIEDRLIPSETRKRRKDSDGQKSALAKLLKNFFSRARRKMRAKLASLTLPPNLVE